MFVSGVVTWLHY
eukprot:ctg_5683.g550